MADIDHEIKLTASPEQVFQALTTAKGLQGWHTPDVIGTGAVGSEWQLSFTGRPPFTWRVTAAEPASRVTWECTSGPGDSVGTTVTFNLAPAGDGRTLLTCRHAGWPGTVGNFRKCNTTWGVLLHHLKQYVESGAAAPAFQ